jgi:hypothetical protein
VEGEIVRDKGMQGGGVVGSEGEGVSGREREGVRELQGERGME